MFDPRSAWKVVEEFEQHLCEYTGAKHAVAVDSCTNALRLCFERWKRRFPDEKFVNVPKHTYVGVPQAAMRAGLEVRFVDWKWSDTGMYYIWPSRVIDSARLLKRGMYTAQMGAWMCLSFHAFKHLPIGRGGAILCDDEDDAEWFRRARYDGRDQTKPIMGQTEFQFGIHCYMPPEAAARGLLLMNNLADHNEPLPGTYPDLSKVRFT